MPLLMRIMRVCLGLVLVAVIVRSILAPLV